MTEAWVGSTPLQCVEGTRVLQLDGCTVTVASVFPDNTAYVIARKTFEKRVIDAARWKWKEQSKHRYGGFTSRTYEAWQAAYGAQEQSVKDDMEKYMRDMLDDLWRKY